MTTPAEFIRQVKQEGTKVTWPSRRETVMSALMILIVVVIFAGFFFATDYLIASTVDCGLRFDNVEHGGRKFDEYGKYIGHCGVLGRIIKV